MAETQAASALTSRPGAPASLRIAHTADVHIGEPGMSDQRLCGLRYVIDAANSAAADALIIAGDLFDHARIPAPEVESALHELSRARMTTVIATGNHDGVGLSAVYHRVRAGDLGSHLHLLDGPDGRHLVLDAVKLTVWSRGVVEHSRAFDPLAGYQRIENDHWHVVIAHGHYVPDGEPVERSAPLHEKDLGRLDCDYVALGHWHRFLQVGSQGPPAYYPGSPSESYSSYPSFNLVTLRQGAAALVERVPLPAAPARTILTR